MSSRSSAKTTELRPGQAMLESLLAILTITCLFLGLFELSRLLTGKIMLEHAAMRVARARAVGFNEFMCKKAARVCIIPVAGERKTPSAEEKRDEPALARMYMRTPNSAYAGALLDYEDWDRLDVRPDGGGASKLTFKTDLLNLEGEAQVDSYPIYLNREEE